MSQQPRIPKKKVRAFKDLARRIDAEEASSIQARGRAAFARHERLQNILHLLRAERERLGLSLSELSVRTGIDKGNLSRLENDPAANPTLDTLQRYAEAIGREILIDLAELPEDRRAG